MDFGFWAGSFCEFKYKEPVFFPNGDLVLKIFAYLMGIIGICHGVCTVLGIEAQAILKIASFLGRAKLLRF